ncbi:MAG TPA: GDSL-type esterase/lipase family protein [Nevskiaceae bacterium]|nr:GDSL-type esterase/lipase family protein [Nevskiaceae bacterium]
MTTAEVAPLPLPPAEIGEIAFGGRVRERLANVGRRLAAGALAVSAALTGTAVTETVEATPAQADTATVTCQTPGTVCAWGDNERGEFGNGTSDFSTRSPIPITGLKNITAIAGVDAFSRTIALDSGGAVWEWGGDRMYAGHAIQQVAGISNAKAIANGTARYALRSDGRVMAWGDNGSGQLGNGEYNVEDNNPPVQVKGLGGISAIASGSSTGYALHADGTVYAWGEGLHGELGNGVYRANSLPVKVQELKDIVSITASARNGFALDSHGDVWAWGSSDLDLLGEGVHVDASIPRKVEGLSDIQSLSATSLGLTVYALSSSGKVWAWGFNALGQLGDGRECFSGATSSGPVLVDGLPKVVSLGAGVNNGYAIGSDGSKWSWGQNNAGQLGNPDIAIGTCSKPVQIQGLGRATALAGGIDAGFAMIGDPSAPIPRKKRYVALGDSYSSGEGAPSPKFLAGTDVKGNQCHRSSAAYPELVYKATMKKYAEFIFKACSGARIQDFYRSNQGNKNEPKQLSWLDKETELVTFTIGGNNLGFKEVIQYCATRHLAGDPTCQQKYGKMIDQRLKTLASTNPKAEDALPALYQAVKKTAPNATILAEGYTRIFPVNPPKTCATGLPSRNFGRTDMLWLNAQTEKLNAVIKKAATARGIVYVDNSNAFRGHELCTSVPYVNRILVGPNTIPWSFHPKISGHKELAAIAIKKL